MDRAEPYRYVRFTWWRDLKPTDLIERFKDDFTLTFYPREERGDEIGVHRAHRWEILVKADTLSVFLGPNRACLFQQTRGPFTQRDLKLREKVLSLYPHGFLLYEPKFEVEEK